MAPQPDELSPAAKAQYWVSRILTISLLMFVPGLAGWWVDQRLGTKALFMLLGFVAGWSAAFWRLMHLKDAQNDATPPDESNSNST